MKRAAITELVEFMTSQRGVITELIYPEAVAMVRTNLRGVVTAELCFTLALKIVGFTPQELSFTLYQILNFFSSFLSVSVLSECVPSTPTLHEPVGGGV